EVTPQSILEIIGELVIPFIVGQLLHRRIGSWLAKHRILVSIVDQGSVLLVVYAAFSTGVTQGLWTIVPPVDLLKVIALSSVLLALVLGIFIGLAGCSGSIGPIASCSCSAVRRRVRSAACRWHSSSSPPRMSASTFCR